MAFDLTAADPLMKQHFNPKIVKQHNTAAVLHNRFFEAKGVPISNRGLEIPLHVAPNADYQFFADGGTMPAGGQQVLTRSVVGFQSFALGCQFTGAALDAAGDDEVTYARALTFNIKNATIDAIKYLNIYEFLDGTGIKGLMGASPTLSTTANTSLDVSGSADGSRYFRVGETIDIMQGSTSTIRQAGLQIVAIADSTHVTVGPSPAATAITSADALVTTNSFNRAISGLKLIIDDGTISTYFQNVNRVQVTQFQSNIISLSGTPPLARDYLRRAIALIQIARGAVSPDELEIWSHPAQLHAYADMGWTLKRFMGGGAKKMDLGYTAYEWEGIPWVIDTDCPKDHLFFLDKSALLKATARELSFDDRTGAILRQNPSATAGRYDDKFVAFLIARFNLGTYSPNSLAKVKGLAVPSGY